MGPNAFRIISELREFATFPASVQRSVRRSLDVAGGRRDALRLWARSRAELDDIKRQREVYARIDEIKALVPDGMDLDPMGRFIAPLLSLSEFDLRSSPIESFCQYRFLYERLLGVTARPWLPAAFLAASALPSVEPERRRTLLSSLGEGAATAPGWSSREVLFFPSWVDKVSIEAA